MTYMYYVVYDSMTLLVSYMYTYVYHINRKQPLKLIRNKSYDTKVIVDCKRNL